MSAKFITKVKGMAMKYSLGLCFKKYFSFLCNVPSLQQIKAYVGNWRASMFQGFQETLTNCASNCTLLFGVKALLIVLTISYFIGFSFSTLLASRAELRKSFSFTLHQVLLCN